MGTVDLGKISFTQRGTYDNSTSYAPKDVVQHTDQNETSSFVKIGSTATGQVPQTNGTINSSHWQIFAKGSSVASANQGTYDASTTYSKGAVVQFTDSGVLSTFLYINTTPASGQTPSTGGTVNSSHWQLIAKGTASVAISWQSAAKTANFTAAASEGYFVDTNGGEVTVTTPSSPSAGDEFIITDLRGTFGTNKVNIAPNGSDKIKGENTTQNIEEDFANVRMVYSGSTYGWIVVTSGAIDKIPVTRTYNVQYLVVGAGGGGGGDNGGGGGAGGMRFNSSRDFAVIGGTTYTITVGTGGLGGHNDPVPGGSGNPLANNGGNSIFSTKTSAGGGGGGSSSTNGAAGGSGGAGGQGGSGGAGNTPSTSPSQGNDGGNGGSSGTGTGGGGGGAGASGGTPGGGNGLANSITGSSVTYAGGGGGGEDQSSNNNAGNGGSGGGGNGSNSGNGAQGTDNLGGGGGGGHQAGNALGGQGGKGVVILRMLTSDYSGTTTGSPTVTTTGSGASQETIVKFTSTGSYTA